MGRRLSKIFEKRLIGDYSFAPEINREEAREVLSWAEEFIKEIRAYLIK